MKPYQPRWVRGQATTPSERDAETRYLAIKDALGDHEIERVLDFGAYGGYFSFRLAEDFGCRVVAVDDHHELKRGIAANRNPLVEGVHHRMSVDEVRELGSFDVVLALSVLHHVEHWAEMLVALKDAASTFLFIETPGPDEFLPKALVPLEPIWTAVESLGGEAIAEVAGYDGRYTRELKVVR
jgi:2-polyprenyl-3-methyl-5-hydroxy-6-metoxy-1,4-benzoquinol methylase